MTAKIEKFQNIKKLKINYDFFFRPLSFTLLCEICNYYEVWKEKLCSSLVFEAQETNN